MAQLSINAAATPSRMARPPLEIVQRQDRAEPSSAVVPLSRRLLAGTYGPQPTLTAPSVVLPTVRTPVASTERRWRTNYIGFAGGNGHPLSNRAANKLRSNLNRPVSADKTASYVAESPVLPKPPTPRSVAGSSVTASNSAGSTWATTSWAIRIPRVTRKGSSPRLMSATLSSPR